MFQTDSVFEPHMNFKHHTLNYFNYTLYSNMLYMYSLNTKSYLICCLHSTCIKINMLSLAHQSLCLKEPFLFLTHTPNTAHQHWNMINVLSHNAKNCLVQEVNKKYSILTLRQIFFKNTCIRAFINKVCNANSMHLKIPTIMQPSNSRIW